jgi:hypothetical protein
MTSIKSLLWVWMKVEQIMRKNEPIRNSE